MTLEVIISVKQSLVILLPIYSSYKQDNLMEAFFPITQACDLIAFK